MGKIVYHSHNNLYIQNSNIFYMLKYKLLKNSVGGDLPIIENNANHLYLH